MTERSTREWTADADDPVGTSRAFYARQPLWPADLPVDQASGMMVRHPRQQHPMMRRLARSIRVVLSTILVAAICCASPSGGRQATTKPPAAAPAVVRQGRAIWTKEHARAWADSAGWLVGSNFIPSTAINQLEMWQADTFDPRTIDRELGWGEALGFNTMRVFLHDLLWQQDSAGFLKRVDEFLAIADRHHIRPMFVLFDAVWDPLPHLGKQRPPIPHLHNSGWVQSPGAEVLADTTQWRRLQAYVQGVVGHFAGDRRVLAWDLFNEPDNVNRPAYIAFEPIDKPERAFQLLRKTFEWARAMNPTQPLTAAPWKGDWVDSTRILPITAFMLANSDVITFHSYADSATVESELAALERRVGGRPVICSEYMARPRGSTFQKIMPVFAREHVGAINWGFVSGKSQTIYPWDSWNREYTAEPKPWFHDVFRSDGTPYDSTEVAFIRRLTRKR